MKHIRLIALLLTGLGLAAYAAPMGWVSEEEQTFDCGDVIQIEAQPVTGYEFDQWDDGDKNNPREIDVRASKTYIAQFRQTPPTALDDVDNVPTARKVLIEQKMYIIIGDLLYDSTGKRVR